MKFHKKITAYYQKTVGIQNYRENIQCRSSAAIHVNFSHYLRSHRPLRNTLCTQGGGMSLKARSHFRWKLHPSIQAWPLLSTSNRGKTAIANCGNWSVRMDKRRIYVSCFLVVQKGFDYINQDLLLKMLSLYGTNGRELMWFQNYITNRRLCVHVNRHPLNY